jgi:hypothetical protein
VLQHRGSRVACGPRLDGQGHSRTPKAREVSAAVDMRPWMERGEHRSSQAAPHSPLDEEAQTLSQVLLQYALRV